MNIQCYCPGLVAHKGRIIQEGSFGEEYITIISTYTNSIMKRYLKQLENNPATETPCSLTVVRNANFIENSNCVLVQMDGVCLPTRDALPKDKTGFEASYNHIHLTDYAATQGDMNPMELLRFGLDIVDTWARNLKESYPNAHFHIVLSFDEEDCVIRLYKLRNGEIPWIDVENVEDFKLEGVLVYHV